MKIVKVTYMSEVDTETLVNWTPNILTGDNGELLVLESEWSQIDQSDFKDSFTVEYVTI